MGNPLTALARLGQFRANRQTKLFSEALVKAKDGRLQEAIALLARAYPRNAAGWRGEVALGDVLAAAGQHSEAANSYLNAMKVNPEARPAFRKYLNAIRAAQRVNEAEAELRGLICQYPDNPNPHNYWAVMLHLIGRAADAQPVWQEVIATWPKYAPAHSNLGYAYQLEGKLDQAVLEYKLAIQLEPDSSIAAYNNLADIYMGRGDFSSAIKHLETAVRLEGYLSVPYATLGHCYGAQGRIEDAIAAYHRSLECEPGVTTNDTRTEVLNNLAKLYLGQHQAERAKECCEEALSRSVNNPDALTTLGQAYFQLGDYPQAVEMFRRALSASPMSLRNLSVHKHLALTYYKMGHFDRAAAEYKHANSWYPDHLFSSNARFAGADGRKVAEELVARCKADLLTRPDDPELHSQAGDGYLYLGCLDDAIPEYRAAVSLRGDDPQLLCQLGMGYYTNDQGLMAVQCFTKALEVNPGFAPAHVGLGLTLLRTGSVDTAILKFEWALAINPRSCEARNFLGNAFRQKGELEKAVTAYQQAIEVNPEYAQAHNNLGQTLLALARYEEAADAFRRAVAILPDYAPAFCNLGRALKALGRDSEAIGAWQKALKINPSNLVAQELLRQQSPQSPSLKRVVE